MLEWLKKLLEEGKIDDGKLDVDGLMDQIRKAFPENAVPKTEFNELNDKLKDANKTLADLKKANEGNENLQTSIKEYETKIAELESKAITREKEIALIGALKEAGALDPDYIVFKNGGLEKFELEDGKVKGLEEIVKQSKEQYPAQFPSQEAKTAETEKTTYQKVAEKVLNNGTGKTDPPVNSLTDALASHYTKK